MKDLTERHAPKSSLSDIILGGQDGLVNVLGLVLGLAAAASANRVILAGGLAATFAEGVSMGAVAYTSKIALRDQFRAEQARELKEMDEVPQTEQAEVKSIFAAKGFEGKLLDDITAHITSDRKLWLATMMREELGLTEIPQDQIYRESFVVGVSTIIGSLLPLAPFFAFPSQKAVWLALVVAVLALGFVGVYKARTTVGRPIKSAAQMIVIGIGSALVGYAIGLMFR